MKPVAIVASGMVTGVGLTSAASCAAIRCAIDNFSETRFIDSGGEWIIGSQVPLEKPWRGLPKLVHMVVPAIRECLADARGAQAAEIPLLLCVAEKERPGRPAGLDVQLPLEIHAELGLRFHQRSAVFAHGRVAGALAVEQASRLVHEEGVPYCIVAGVDSFLEAETLAYYEGKSRLLTSQNSDGFIPGEAGAAILISAVTASSTPSFRCLGFGVANETAMIDAEEPLRGEGLFMALKSALTGAGCIINDLDYRITDCNGEQYGFKEATLALNRILRKRKEPFDIWHPADCIGETGAAIGPCVMAVAWQAARRGYAYGRGPLCHFSAEDSRRAAVVFSAGNNN